MDWRKNSLLIAAFVGMMVLGTAITVTFDNETDAKNALGTNVLIEKSEKGCEIAFVSKSGTTANEIDTKDYTFKWIMHYKKDGKDKYKSGFGYVASANDNVVKVAAQPLCDNAWTEAKTEGTINKVIIRPELGVLQEFYDYVAKQWKDKPVAEDLNAE